MPGLDDHSGFQFVKGLYLGDPGSGKTGSLASLVAAGYDLRVYDFDNLLGTLAQYVRKTSPERLHTVKFQTFTDKMKGQDQPVVMVGNAMKVNSNLDGPATAFPTAMRQLNHWKTPTEDLGKPASWGENTVVVIDTLSRMSDAAFRYANYMNPAAREPQAVYFAAQQMVVGVLALLGSESFRTNVLVLAHISYDKNHLELTKGFPRSVGSALNSVVGSYFNCVLLAETVGSTRKIKTKSTGIVDLKNPVDFKVPGELPLETGLADFFKAVKD